MSSIPHPVFAGLAPTEKLYHAAPELDNTQARILGVHENRIVLDRTVFYAEAGGQVADRGFVGGKPVLSVTKAGGIPVKIERPGLDPIWVATDTLHLHEVEDATGLEPGATVDLMLDRPYRNSVRGHHTAAHFLYLALRNVLARKNEAIFTKGCHINTEGFRFDLANELTAEEVAEVEKIANAEMERGLPIAMHVEGTADDVFYWTYGNHIIPCGGTHLSTTHSLPPIALRRRSKGKGTLRVSGTF
jgi:alanyl-tRNA synthetase